MARASSTLEHPLRDTRLPGRPAPARAFLKHFLKVLQVNALHCLCQLGQQFGGGLALSLVNSRWRSVVLGVVEMLEAGLCGKGHQLHDTVVLRPASPDLPSISSSGTDGQLSLVCPLHQLEFELGSEPEPVLFLD